VTLPRWSGAHGGPSQVGTEGEASLVGLAAAGDRPAFEMLLESRLDRLYRLASSIMCNEADASDATQDACVLAWRKLPTLRDHARFDAWLSQILVNSCRGVLRAHRRRTAHEIVAVDNEANRQERGPTVAAEADRLGEVEAIRAAFSRLDADPRALLVLHYVEGRPLAEIGRVMRVPVGTLKWRLSRARQALQHALEVEGR
jgi:RNA polymerase sigma-70 factor (ECF subfamily)